MHHENFGKAQISAQLLWRGMTSHPALVLKVYSHSIGVPSWVILLLSHHGKGNLFLGIFGISERTAIIFNLVNLLTFGFVCTILHCLVASGIFQVLGYTYSIGFGL